MCVKLPRQEEVLTRHFQRIFSGLRPELACRVLGRSYYPMQGAWSTIRRGLLLLSSTQRLQHGSSHSHPPLWCIHQRRRRCEFGSGDVKSCLQSSHKAVSENISAAALNCDPKQTHTFGVTETRHMAQLAFKTAHCLSPILHSALLLSTNQPSLPWIEFHDIVCLITYISIHSGYSMIRYLPLGIPKASTSLVLIHITCRDFALTIRVEISFLDGVWMVSAMRNERRVFC